MSDALSRVLFEHEDRTLLNIKFLKGDGECSKKEFRDTVANLLQGVETGLIEGRSEFGDKDIRRIDVKDAVAKL